MRLPLLVPLVVGALALGLAPAATAVPGGPTPYQHRLTESRAGAARGPLTVGDLTLRPCTVVAHAWCGHVQRPWDPAHPDQGTLRVGFAFAPARDHSRPALGTFVPHEGGPGYSTTGTGPSYAAMYGPLLRRHNLLLVDQRGTGRSSALPCPDLQNLRTAYSVAARRCGRSLGSHSDDYTTARSADDLAAVIARLGLGRVDLYGDSYGTFFAQVFAGRHPDLLRSLVLDGAYPTHGETAWYPTQGPAMRSSFAKACRRSPACRGRGPSFARAMRRVLRQVRRHPWHGLSHDADGRRAHVTVSPETLATTAFGATYGPYTYRELTAALRAALDGDRVPLLREVAEAEGGGTDAGPVRDYSEGLDAAVACHDYPQLYDMTAPPEDPPAAVRPRPGTPYGDTPVDVRSLHRPRVRPLRLAGARLVHPLAEGRCRQPGATAASPRRSLPERAHARAERRARLHHHAGRGCDGDRRVPAGRAHRGRQQLPRGRRG